MKKIGFITMHRIQNYGSILQTYALQQKLKNIGVENEIIDYIFPSPSKKGIKSFCKDIVKYALDGLLGFPLMKQKKRFKSFYKNNLIITPNAYDKKSIATNPPIFDAYISGSDQVWNPQTIKDDTTFLLSFVPDDKPRASFSSSFTMNELPKELHSVYTKELQKFSSISVREESGVSIVKSLIGKEAKLVCDPTLLLDKKDWDKIAAKSAITIKEKYILVYILAYMYNPYPEIDNLIEKVQKELGNLKVIYLTGRKEDLFKPNSRLIKDAGPNEFVYLFKNAEFVITTSFHGTVFSLIYNKPLYAVVKDLNTLDGRIPSLLAKAGCSSSLINYDAKKINDRKNLLLQKSNLNKLLIFKYSSEETLKDILNHFNF